MNRGFIRNIILIVGALVALKYFFHFDLVSLLSEGNYREVWDWLYNHALKLIDKIRS